VFARIYFVKVCGIPKVLNVNNMNYDKINKRNGFPFSLGFIKNHNYKARQEVQVLNVC
jgi:hypothetical protein